MRPGPAEEPLVSVVMPVFNGEGYVEEAICSILGQSLENLEFVIVDDGSTDRSPDIIARYGALDRRVVACRRSQSGLVSSLSFALNLAKGRYVARMDADDVSLANRLERQCAFMEQFPHVGILGTAVELIDERGRSSGIRRMPSTDLQIRWTGLLANPFAHSSVMMRRGLLTRMSLTYDAAYPMVEDYRLWTQILMYASGANLTEALVRYRIHGMSISARNAGLQKRQHERVSFEAIREQLPDMPIALAQVMELCAVFVHGGRDRSVLEEQRGRVSSMCLELLACFERSHEGHPELNRVRREVAMRIAKVVLRPPLRRDALALIPRLLALEPLLPARLVAHIPAALHARRGRNLLSSRTLGEE